MANLHQCGSVLWKLQNCSQFPPRNVTSTSTDFPIKSMFDFVVELYLITFLAFIGLCGNVISVIVLRKDKERREALLLLQALAVADAFYLLIALFRYPLKYVVPERHHHTQMQPIVFALLKTFQAITIWMMVLVTIDRYIYVCKPLRAQQLFNSKSRRIFAVCVFIFGFVFTAPRFFESCVMVFHDCSGRIFTRMIYTEAFSDTLYFDIYQHGLYIALLYLGPLSVLFYMNLRLIQAIRHSRRRHRDISTNSDTSDNNATLVLVIIILVFIICETPELMLKIGTLVIRETSHGDAFPQTLVDNFATVSELLRVINSSANFFIYVIFGKRFRQVLKDTICYRCAYNQYSSTAMTPESAPLQNHVHHFQMNNNFLHNV